MEERDGVNLQQVHDTTTVPPGVPLTYFNDGGREGGEGGLSGFFGSEILAKNDFFASMKDASFFGGCEKDRGIFWGCEKRTKGFFVCAKKVAIFWGRQILKL